MLHVAFNPVMVNTYVGLFNCTAMGRASDYDGPDLKLFLLAGASCLLLGPTGFNWCLYFAPDFQ